MRSTVYLNHHFAPKNQSSYYQSNMYEWMMRQENMNNLILEKLNKQQTAMHKQYHHILYCISNIQEEYNELSEILAKLKTCMQQNIQLTNMNNRILLDLVDKLAQIEDTINLKNESYEMLVNNQQLMFTEIEKTNNKFPLVIKELRDNLQSIMTSFTEAEKNVLEKQHNIELNLKVELELTRENLEKNINDQLNGELNALQDSLMKEISNIRGKLDEYLKERHRQSMCDLFRKMNPGTKINKIVLSGKEVKLASFINYEQTTKQVKFIQHDGNLLITNCSDIEAVEINTQKKNEDS